jgi:hypothetical protein
VSARGPAGAALSLNESRVFASSSGGTGLAPRRSPLQTARRSFDDWSEETRDVRGRDGHTGRGDRGPTSLGAAAVATVAVTTDAAGVAAAGGGRDLSQRRDRDDGRCGARRAGGGARRDEDPGGRIGRRHPEIPRPVDEGCRPQGQDRRARLHRHAFAPVRVRLLERPGELGGRLKRQHVLQAAARVA